MATKRADAAREGAGLSVAESLWDRRTTRLRDVLWFHAARGGSPEERAAAERALVEGLAGGSQLHPGGVTDPGSLLGALYPAEAQAAWPEPVRRAFVIWQQGRAVLPRATKDGLHVLPGPQPRVLLRQGPVLRGIDIRRVLRERSGIPQLQVKSRLASPQFRWQDVALPAPLDALVISAPKPRPRGASAAAWWGLALALGAYLAGIAFLISATLRRRRAARLQSDFVAAVSHEMKTPIASVRAMAEFLLDEPDLTPRAQTYARNMTREMERLGGSVRDVLDVARIERSGRLQLDPRPDDPARVLQPLIEQLQPVIEARGRQLVATLAPVPEDARLPIDAEALRSAVRNLIDNAAKFSPPGSTVEVRGEPAGGREAARGEYRIEVLDRGPGIDPAKARRLFKRFVRGEAAKDGAVAGVGLGLHIVQEVVAGHGGRVRVERRDGGGARFIVQLPGGEAA